MSKNRGQAPLPVAVVTNLPVLALRVTVLALPVPRPTRSVVVVLGDAFACLVVTNRPVRALRLTDRAMRSPTSQRDPDLQSSKTIWAFASARRMVDAHTT